MEKILFRITPFVILAVAGCIGTNNFSITSIYPNNNSLISTTPSFTVNFSNSVNLNSTINNVYIVSSLGQIMVNCGLSAQSTQLNCVPSSFLTPNTNYALIFNSGIQDVNGDNLPITTFNYTTNESAITAA